MRKIQITPTTQYKEISYPSIKQYLTQTPSNTCPLFQDISIKTMTLGEHLVEAINKSIT